MRVYIRSENRLYNNNEFTVIINANDTIIGSVWTMAAISIHTHTKCFMPHCARKHGYNILLDWRTFYSFAGFTAKYSFVRMLAKIDKRIAGTHCGLPFVFRNISNRQIEQRAVSVCACDRDQRRPTQLLAQANFTMKLKEEIKRNTNNFCVDDDSVQ